MGIVFQRHAWKLRIFALISICALDFLKIYTFASRMKRKENKQILLWISFYFYIFVILLKKILWHSVAIWERFESICLCERLPQLAAEVFVVWPVEVDTDGVLALRRPRSGSRPGNASAVHSLVEVNLVDGKLMNILDLSNLPHNLRGHCPSQSEQQIHCRSREHPGCRGCQLCTGWVQEDRSAGPGDPAQCFLWHIQSRSLSW